MTANKVKATVIDSCKLNIMNYLNGELHGSASFFDQNGLIASKGSYKNGKSVGIWTYYQNGKKIKEVSKSRSKKERTKKKETTNTKAKK